MNAQRKARKIVQTGRHHAGQNRRALGRIVLLAILVGGLLIGMGPVMGPAGAATASDTLQDVRFGDHGTYERAVLDLGWDHAPGDVAPVYTWRYRNGDWIVRINLPAVESTLKTDGPALGLGISRYYVVRRADDTLAVDLRLRKPAGTVKVFSLDHPARVVVDVRPGGLPLYPEPAECKTAVITAPRLSYLVGPDTFKVSGYGRPFEAQGVWRLKNSAGRVVRQGAYTTNDWDSAWGSFGFEVTYPSTLAGHTGMLQVGDYSPEDGHFRGASVALRFE
ncbi:MAG TPA: Gmad2 immunoglobulin-like domain-containing protein [Rubrobacteraceae bacterium]|nr:Gmad2 immunoglobulin-like domain-containing protein [Rubrobacteraceae bacterium]